MEETHTGGPAVTTVSTWTAESGGLIRANQTDGVAVVTINRPEKQNALNAAMKRDLASAIRYFGRSGTDALGIVVTGEGGTFCAGQDLDELNRPGADIEAAIGQFHDLTRAVLDSTVPTITALSGAVVGGAAEWTLCFDQRIGTPHYFFLMPERRLGLPVSNASSLLLFRLLKGGSAMRVVLDSRRIHADEAERLGLLDKIVAPEELLATATSTLIEWGGEDRRPPTAYLELLRPDRELVERAMARETMAYQVLREQRES